MYVFEISVFHMQVGLLHFIFQIFCDKRSLFFAENFLVCGKIKYLITYAYDVYKPREEFSRILCYLGLQ